MENKNEKTRIVNENDENLSSDRQDTNSEETTPKSDNNKLKSKSSKKNSDNISKGTFAAGAGIAGAAGVAAGTVFSDEIKDVFEGNNGNDKESENRSASNTENNSESTEDSQEINDGEENNIGENEFHVEVTDDSGTYEVNAVDVDGDGNMDSMSIDAELVDGSQISMSASGTALDSMMESDNPLPSEGDFTSDFTSLENEDNSVSEESENTDVPNELHFEMEDSSGYYEITAIDVDGDNQADIMTIEADMVDGSHISMSASGSALDSLMIEDVQLADHNDYIVQASENTFEGFSGECIGASEYHIQSGDTLSEIAAANGTSVAHIMELNPSIDDPNVIYAGDDILIPENDVVSGPYEGWRPEWSDNSTEIIQDEIAYDDEGNMDSQNYSTSEYQMDDDSSGYEENDYDTSQEGDYDQIASESSEFETMDWNSVEDLPMDDYSASLAQEDFSDYDSYDSYYNDDFAGTDFV